MKKGWFITFGIVGLLVLLGGVSLLLFLTVRVQQGLLNKPPDYSATEYYSRAQAQVDKGDYAEAENYLEQALLKQNDDSFRNQLAVVKYRLKKYQEAIDQYRLLLTAGKDPAFCWNGIGNASPPFQL